MTVRELIKALKKYKDQDLEVSLVRDYYVLTFTPIERVVMNRDPQYGKRIFLLPNLDDVTEEGNES